MAGLYFLKQYNSYDCSLVRLYRRTGILIDIYFLSAKQVHQYD